MIISVTSWAFYAIALLLKAYANRVRFMAFPDMPLAFSRSSRFASRFWLTRLAITYGSLAGLWFAHGAWVFGGAFVFYFLFSAITFAAGSRKSVNKWARVNLEVQRQEATARGENFDEHAGWLQALRSGERLVEQNIARNGNL